MTHKIHRMSEAELRRIEKATGRKYPCTTGISDPSVINVTAATVDNILHDLLIIAERANKRWF